VMATPLTRMDPLAALVSEYHDDPEGFVDDAFPWGTGELSGESGPDAWQREFLRDLGRILRTRTFDGSTAVDPVKMAIASGHGIGKSTLFAWLHWWMMSTRPNCKGRVTANTYTQLESTTWAEIQKWWKLCKTREWFEVSGSKAYHKENPEGWFSRPITCAEENSEAFAGQHNKESTSFFLFDESSLIPDRIWEVAEAGLTDGEPMWFAAGNPTRNTGMFYEVCFGEFEHRWNNRSIDSRTCKFPNHRLHAQWIEDHGEDSDFVRVRIRGVAPQQSEEQLIGKDLVDGARKRMIEPFPDEPLVAGVDVPDGGSAWFIVRFRRGLCARPGPLVPAPIRMAGAKVDRITMVATLAKILGSTDPRKRVAAMFVDSQPGAAIVERLRGLGHDRVHEISFAGPSPNRGFGNMRAYMWGKAMKDWLERGCIDPEDSKLKKDLTAPGFHYRVGGDGALLVESKDEMKRRGIPSPDDGDGLALTFAQEVAPESKEEYYPEEKWRHWLA
jgi:hypothetical protein